MWWSVWHQAGFLRMNSNRKCHQFPRSQLWKLFTAKEKEVADGGVKKVKKVKKVKIEGETRVSRQTSTDGDAPVLWQTLFPCWSVSPLSSGTRDASAPTFWLIQPAVYLWLFTDLRSGSITLRFFVLFFVSDSSRAASVSMMLTAVTTRRTAADSSLHKSKTSCNNWLICDKWLSAFLYKSGFLMVVIESFFLFMFLFVLCLFLSLISDSACFYFTSCSRLFQRHKSVCILTQTRLPSSSLNFLITC